MINYKMRLFFAYKIWVNDGDRTHDHRNHNPGLYQLSYVHRIARLAGLEPATHGLEGRCSIQLSYRRIFGEEGFEPPTSCTQSRRATRLRYTPNAIQNNDYLTKFHRHFINLVFIYF